MGKQSRMEIVRHALAELADNDGRIDPERVVTAARNPKHALHGDFNWDDKKAAHQNRLDKARELIRYVTVTTVIHNVKVVTPYYVRDPRKQPNEGGSIAVNSDLLDQQDAEKIMLAELDRCESAINRARAVTAGLDGKFTGISQKFEAMLAHIVSMRAMVDEAA